MSEDKEVHNQGEKTQIVEKRLKPTLIRRRAKTIEALPPSVAGEERATAEAEQDLAVSQEQPSSSTKSAAAATPGTAASNSGVQASTQPTKGEAKPAKIGLVGFIDLGAARPATEDEEAARKVVKGPRRKRSKEEIELEDIQRAGGLLHYAALSRGDSEAEPKDVVELADVTPVERVFQPKPAGRKRKGVRREFKKTQITTPSASKKVLRVEDNISVSGLSQAMGVKGAEIVKKLFDLGVMATINQLVDVDTASLIAQEFGYTIEKVAFNEGTLLQTAPENEMSANLQPRPPIVTVMGHVDHGKTSLLDAIRKTNIAEGEAGGITQHIGAYEVEIPKGKVTFLDTPGHQAFTRMRARGASVTDIVILVVAADDGIMPQTVEAIDHAKAAEVPLIVAINKIDKPQANLDRVKNSLSEHGLVPEDWGGDVICIGTSAKTREGIDKLLEMILLQAEVMELKADPTLRPKGVVIEAKLDKGRGPIATTLIQEGTLKAGQFVVCGLHSGRIRAMVTADGKKVESALPAMPVEILGLSGVPEAGDELIAVKDERDAKQVVESRADKVRQTMTGATARVSLEELQRQIVAGTTAELTLVIKADVHGSIEAVVDSLAKLSTDAVRVKVLHRGVGGITESDVMLAAASKAIVIGFNVKPEAQARQAAEREHVEIRSYRIIYEMIEEVKKAMEGLLSPEEIERSLGSAQVRQVFKVSKVGQIAGCAVVSGKIVRNAFVRLLRDNQVVYEGKISSLKRFKDDAKEVLEGYECGIGIENFNDIKEGDAIEAYLIEKKAVKLQPSS